MRLLSCTIVAVAALAAAVSAASPARASDSPATLNQIYEAITLENLQAQGGTTFASGAFINFTFDLRSHSLAPLLVPFIASYGFPLIGTEQTWVLRLGDADHSLPLPNAGRKGAWYATGGQILVPTNLDQFGRLTYGSIQPELGQLSTTGFPPGRYVYFVEYKPLNGGLYDVLQTQRVSFTLT